MFLRCHPRKKNGKLHRYWSVVESRRLANGQSAQRQLLYLGEINDSQEAAWRKSIEVFDEDKQQSSQACLFPADRPIPADEVNGLSLVMSDIRLLRPRSFGDCWLGCQLWHELGLDRFWQGQLEDQRGNVPWEKVLELLAVNRLCQPASEWAVHRQWFLNSAMGQLLDCDFAVAEKDRLYRCLDRVVAHKDALCRHLVDRWKTLFDARFDILLYDLTSTYFEGQSQKIPKARHVWVMDRGIPTEATLKQMREDEVAYLVGTPKATLDKLERELAAKPWEQVHEGMKVKLLEQAGELYIQAASDNRKKKENAMRRRKLKKLVRGLNRIRRALKRRSIGRDQVLRRVAVLRKEAGRAGWFLKIREPALEEPVNRRTFTAKLDKAAWKRAMDRDGHYILRAHIPWEQWPAGMEKQAPVLWKWYMQLVRVEEAFKALKGELSLRPIHHQLQSRVEAHILVAFLGYCLSSSLRMKLAAAAPGLTPRAALASLSAIQMLEVQVPMTDGRVLLMPRYTEPEAGQKMILQALKLTLPPQPPPRIRDGKAQLPDPRPDPVL